MAWSQSDIELLKSFKRKHAATGGDIMKADGSVIALWAEVERLAQIFLGHHSHGCGVCNRRDFEYLYNINVEKLCQKTKS